MPFDFVGRLFLCTFVACKDVFIVINWCQMKKLFLLIACLSGFVVAASAEDVSRQLERVERATGGQVVQEANKFFKLLHDEEFLDTLYQYDKKTAVDTLREQVWYWAAEYFYDCQQYEQTLTCGRKALPLYKEGNNRNGEADCLSLMAIANIRLANYEEAAEYAKLCYALDEASGEPWRMASSLNTLAGIYLAAHQPKEAERYILAGLEMSAKANNLEQRAVLLGTASEVFHSLVNDEEALRYANEAYALEEKLGRKDKAMVRLSQKASALIGLKRFAEAEHLLDTVIPFLKQQGNYHSYAISCNKLGMALQCQKREKEAITYYRQAAAVFSKMGDAYNELHARRGLYESLWKIEPDSARMELERFNSLKDSLYTHASAESMARYNAEFGNDLLQKEKEAEHTGKQRAILFGLAGILALSGLVFLVWWIMRRRHQRQALINHELSENIAQLREQYEQLSIHYDHALQTKPNEEERTELTVADRDFLEKTVNIVNELIHAGQIDADSVARELGMSLFQFRQRLTALTNETPQAFIANIRMKRARHLLDNHPELNISEIAQLCAYNDTPNFTRAFKKTFGLTPTQFLERHDTGM